MSVNQPKVSIVIPCYNHGKYILETIESIETIADKNLYEVIIVNDGSTDEYTNKVLTDIKDRKANYTVIFQENQGVCIARNNALKHAKGEYILPVDADNNIKPDYIPKALEILEHNKDISVVYTDSELFGNEKGIRVAGPYNLQRLMLGNFIDNCSLYRRSMIDDIGYIDTYETINGIEDWEFWLRASFNGHKFHYINEPLFEYRVLSDSGSARLQSDKIKGIRNTDYFIEKHSYYYGAQYVDKYFTDKFKQSPIGFIGKLVLKIYFPKWFKKLVGKGKLRKYI